MTGRYDGMILRLMHVTRSYANAGIVRLVNVAPSWNDQLQVCVRVGASGRLSDSHVFNLPVSILCQSMCRHLLCVNISVSHTCRFLCPHLSIHVSIPLSFLACVLFCSQGNQSAKGEKVSQGNLPTFSGGNKST